MKRLSEAIGGAPAKALSAPATGMAGTVFKSLHAVYGAQWLDRWRTGELDDQGRDTGILIATEAWDKALAKFTRAQVMAAIPRVRNRQWRNNFAMSPSLGEFEDLCRSVQVPQPLRLEDATLRSGQVEGRDRISELRTRGLIGAVPPQSPIERLTAVIVKAAMLAGNDDKTIMGITITKGQNHERRNSNSAIEGNRITSKGARRTRQRTARHDDKPSGL